MRRTAAILCWCAAAAVAQTALGPARIGCFRDDAGRLRSLFGVAGSFVVGEPEQDGVVAAACASERSFLKTETYLELRDAGGTSRWEAPPGPALFAFSRDGSAAACFAENSECLWLDTQQAARVVSPGGEVLAIALPDAERLRAVVRQDGNLWLVELSPGGSIAQQFELDGVSAPLALRPDGTVLYADGAELVVRTRHGAEQRVRLPSPPAALEQIGEDWVRISLANAAGHLALLLRQDGDGELYRLPEVLP